MIGMIIDLAELHEWHYKIIDSVIKRNLIELISKC